MPVAIDVPIRLDITNIEFVRQISTQVMRVVHERDNYVCRCCGFRSTKYQQVLNLNGNWRDLDAITTACIFCQQCFSLDAAAQMRSGVLLIFPDMEQSELNRLAVEIYLARVTGNESAMDQANRCLAFLMNLREAAVDQFGSYEPTALAGILRDGQTDGAAETVKRRLTRVRLFPSDRRILRQADLEYNQFPQIMAFWRSAAGPYPGSSASFPALESFVANYL
jgi:intracellular multiplication protein IcmJ